jgi:hypothetical protein
MTEEQMLLDRAYRGWQMLMSNLLRATLIKHQEETGHRIAWLVFRGVGEQKNYG